MNQRQHNRLFEANAKYMLKEPALVFVANNINGQNVSYAVIFIYMQLYLYIYI